MRSTLSLDNNRGNKGNRKKKRFASKGPPFLFDLFSALTGQKRAFHPQKIERVLHCATCFRRPDGASH